MLSLIGEGKKNEVIEREIDLCGYFCIVTSQKITAKEAYL